MKSVCLAVAAVLISAPVIQASPVRAANGGVNAVQCVIESGDVSFFTSSDVAAIASASRAVAPSIATRAPGYIIRKVVTDADGVAVAIDYSATTRPQARIGVAPSATPSEIVGGEIINAIKRFE